MPGAGRREPHQELKMWAYLWAFFGISSAKLLIISLILVLPEEPISQQLRAVESSRKTRNWPDCSQFCRHSLSKRMPTHSNRSQLWLPSIDRLQTSSLMS
jgi:hypothetical protein